MRILSNYLHTYTAVYAVLTTPIMLCIYIVVSEVCYYIAKPLKH